MTFERKPMDWSDDTASLADFYRAIYAEASSSHGAARRLDRRAGRASNILDWGRRYLPGHFSRAAVDDAPLAGRAAWHRAARAGNEDKRPCPARSGQIDARHARHAVAGRHRGLGTVHLDRVGHEASGLRPSRKRQGRVARKPQACRRLSDGRGPRDGFGAKTPSCCATA